MELRGPTRPYPLPKIRPQRRRRWLTGRRFITLNVVYILLVIAVAMIAHAWLRLVP